MLCFFVSPDLRHRFFDLKVQNGKPSAHIRKKQKKLGYLLTYSYLCTRI
jgi:hypothetical protein